MKPMFFSLRLAAMPVLAMTLPLAAAGPARFTHFTYAGHALERASANPGEYRNPVLAGYYPDPSVTRVGDDYYLVNSSFAHFPGLPVWTSKDLVNWRQIGNAIDRAEQLDLSDRAVSEGVFAPDISFHSGIFYIVNTCVGCRGNFVITAANPAGPWSNPIWLPFEGIDPSIYWEGDRAFIVNNRAPNEPPRYAGHRAIWVQEYDWRAGKMVGESTQLVNGGVDITRKPAWIEGPHLFKREGWYYLTAAEGGTGDNHSQVVFRSRNLRGPFVPFAGNPILTQRDLPRDRANPVTSAGHADLVQTQRGDWWATFLATRPYADGMYNVGRETFLLPVTWRDGWPVILDRGKPIPLVAPRPDLPAAPRPALPTSGDFSYVDDFAGDRLAMQWVGIRAPERPFYKVAGGTLELGSGARLGDRQGVPAFVGRRQQHADATVSVMVSDRLDHDGDRAGLAAVQSDRSFVFFGLARIDGRPQVALYTRDQADTDTLIGAAPLDATGAVTLTMRITGGSMAFDYRAAGRPLRTLKAGLDASLLSTARAGGFVGTVIGPYAYGGRAPA